MRQSLIEQVRNSFPKLRKNKRGAVLDMAQGFMIGLMAIAIVGVLTIIVLNQLGQTSVISSNTQANQTIGNVTNAIPNFFSNAGTWLTLLSIVVIVAVVVVVIRVFNPGGFGSRESL